MHNYPHVSQDASLWHRPFSPRLDSTRGQTKASDHLSRVTTWGSSIFFVRDGKEQTFWIDDDNDCDYYHCYYYYGFYSRTWNLKPFWDLRNSNPNHHSSFPSRRKVVIKSIQRSSNSIPIVAVTSYMYTIVRGSMLVCYQSNSKPWVGLLLLYQHY